ncbi:CHASE domain-containing protein [Vibrio parahaemolyticus]|nr:response regulator [Vibrio vulnificus]HCG5553106.1 CHASE domain-containing protein [Vibrio parahaemolyticus]HAS6291536.1 response regulator [Vibrio vulnificus]HAS6315496.1 response regulator [Vibrio vulnificus]HCG6132301.1 CHASE domain-containing protein [Vibrio parahaemolyticus]
MKLSLSKKLSSVLVWLPLVAGALLTTLVALLLNFQNREDDKANIKQLATQAESFIQERFSLYEYGLRGARGAIVTAGPEFITRKQFENYIGSRDIPREFPGALGFGFIRKVAVKDEQRFIQKARQEGILDFSIRTLHPHDKDRFVIEYIYPIAPNKQAIGLDIGSETNRRKAALASARENRAYLTEPITLVQADQKARRGVLILLPIFPSGLNLETPQEREDNVVGWSYAPLIIDDVLAGLPSVFEQAQIQLSSQSETTPFYVSTNSGNHYHTEDTLTRIINVMGQQWKLELVPNDKAYLTHRWSTFWSLAVGMVLTLILVLAVNLLSTYTNNVFDETDQEHQGAHRFLLFIKSHAVKKTWPPAAVALLVVFMLAGWFLVNGKKSELSDQLISTNHNIYRSLDAVAEQYKRDILFLANTPPVQAMLELQSKGGFNMREYSDEQMLERIEEIFKAYMLTSQEVYQVRFLTEQSHWREQVKVQREGSELISFDDESLQNKSSEPYISQTLAVGKNHVYMSDVNLNREYGVIEVPHKPMWRFSTPVYFNDGSLLGLIIINLNARTILDNLVLTNNSAIHTYITNSNGEYIVHPDVSKAFAFERGRSFQWNSEFSLETPSLLAISYAKEYEGASGDIWAVESQFRLDSSSTPRYLNIYSASSKLPYLISLSWQMFMVLLSILVIATVSICLQYWLWLSALVAHRENWNQQLQYQQTKELSRFKTLLESSPEATLIVEQSGIIKMVNAEAEKVFGLLRERLEHHSVNKLIPPKLRQSYGAYLAAYMRRPRHRRMAASRKLLALKGSGETFPVEISLSAVPMEDELLVSVSLRDITERLKAEQKLTVALRDAENATRAKSAFLANTSHEIRTPLNAIIGLTHLLSNETLTNSQRLLVDKISLSGKSLLGIVNDVLDLSKIEANEMSLELLPVELRDFVDEVSSVFAIQAEQKDINFALTLSPELPDWVEADAVRLKQVLVNLLGNALKFTDIGKIELNVEPVSSSNVDGKPKTTVRFSVSDTGIGISQSNLSRLFRPFSQADASTTRRFGGTGLGLSIVSQLVALMGGKIAVNSVEGKGSVFWVDIPFPVTSANDVDVAEQYSEQMLYLIIAEDDVEDAKHIMSLTRSLGWRAELVGDGQALVELFISRREQGLRLPDALIVDWKMPHLDGITALEILAQQFDKEQLPAVLMVSAFGRAEITHLDTQHLIDTFLQKPVYTSTLFNAVNDTVCRLTGNIERVLNATTTEQIKAKWLTNVRILVVDDSDTNLEVATYLLTQAGASVETANSGEVAISKLKESPLNYDAILMDVQMPVMDGLEATRYIRQTLELKSIPIIALTAGALVEERKRALESGMNDFLTKPISPTQLISVLRTQVSQYWGKNIEVEEIKVPIQQEESWPVIDGLDITQAKELLMNNKELFFNTLKHLLEGNENLILNDSFDMTHLANADIRQSLASQAHKLRSSAGMIGAQRLHHLASTAENILREGESEAEQALLALSSELKKLKRASKDAIVEWDTNEELFITATVSDEVVSLDLANQLLKMFNEQDLNALTLVEEQKKYLFNVLGKDNLSLLLESTKRLNFKQAAEVLEPFVVSSRKSND